VKDSGIGIE